MPRRTLLGLLATIAVLAAPTAVGAAPYQHTTQPTGVGSGGAAATVDSVATTAATDALRRGDANPDIDPERLIEVIGGATMLRLLLWPDNELDDGWVDQTTAIVAHGVIA